jgi:protein gp37
MGANSRIEWTNATWNPVTGCSFISEGCANCYARRMANRLEAMGLTRYRNGFRVTVHPDLLDAPLNWRKPRLIFVNSMSDLFHEDVPFDFIARVFSTISLASCHVFQILTKRADRLAEVVGELKWPANLWVGVTVESQEYVHRINKLSSVPSNVRFVSFEPLLGPIKNLDLSSVDWAIVGGESGPHSRKMDPNWARMIRDACLEQSIPFFFKQWGGTKKSGHNRILDGKTWDQYPQEAMA